MTTQPPAVELQRWTPAWAERFAEARAQLASVLPADATIEHIGSTSVPGLLAKPIIDILVTTSSIYQLRADTQDLEALGYTYNPKYFPDDPDHLFLKRDTDGQRTEHLHIFHPRSSAPQANRAFRDFLRTHPAEAQRYSDAKWAAAQVHPNSRGAYGQAKELILQELLGSALDWAGA